MIFCRTREKELIVKTGEHRCHCRVVSLFCAAPEMIPTPKWFQELIGDHFGVDVKRNRDHFGVDLGIISGAVQFPKSGDHWCCFNCRPRGTVNSEPRVLPFSHGPVQQFHLQFKHVSRTKEAQTWVFYLVAWFSHLIIKLSPNKIQLWMIISCPWWCRWGVHCEQKIGTAKTTEVKCSSFNLVVKTYHGRSNAGTPWQARACVCVCVWGGGRGRGQDKRWAWGVREKKRRWLLGLVDIITKEWAPNEQNLKLVKIQIKLKSTKSLHHYYGLTFALRVIKWFKGTNTCSMNSM